MVIFHGFCEGEAVDVARLAHHVSAFQRLPWRWKLAAMLEDGALLWLLAFVVPRRKFRGKLVGNVMGKHRKNFGKALKKLGRSV